MSDPFCDKCGTRLHGVDQQRGTCPRCLLGLGLDTPPLHLTGEPAPAARAPELEEIAALLPRFDFLEVLGRGGMGAVYKARQRDLQRIVAIKVLLPDLGRDPAFAERFLREAQALANLDHAGIVDVYDFGQQDGVYYFVMEYVDGTNLRQLQAVERLGSREALGIVSQMCEALQYAHEHGVVHRDIKPENILVDRQGRVKITDFGLAKLAETGAGLRLTRSDQVMGTLHYMAPEQIERPQSVDHRADLYSLGVVFYELLTGELPLGHFEPPSSRATIDGRLDEVVMRALAKEPARRYQAASALERDVRHISSTVDPRAQHAGGHGRPSPPPPPGSRSGRAGLHSGPAPRRPHALIAIVVGVVLLVGLTVAAVVATNLVRRSATLDQEIRSAAADQRALAAQAQEAEYAGPLSLADLYHPRLRSGPLHDELRSQPALRPLVEAQLALTFREYRQLEGAAERSRTRNGDSIECTFDSFPEERAGLEQRLRSKLSQNLGRPVDALVDAELLDALMPYGKEPVRVEVEHPGGWWRWSESTAGPQRRPETAVLEGSVPPSRIWRLWTSDGSSFRGRGPGREPTVVREVGRDADHEAWVDVSSDGEERRVTAGARWPQQESARSRSGMGVSMMAWALLACVGLGGLTLLAIVLFLVARRRRVTAEHRRAVPRPLDGG